MKLRDALYELAQRYAGTDNWGVATVVMTLYVMVKVLDNRDAQQLRRFHLLVRDFMHAEQMKEWSK